MESLALNRGFWQDRPTLVTGATGLVGGFLIRRLLSLKADVVCLVRDWVPQSEIVRSTDIEQTRVVRGDVRDQATLERTLGEYEVATVIHLAAQTIVPIANRNPVSTFETNIAGTWALLEACRRSPAVKEVVVASSDKAYGDQEVLPYTEDTPLAGQHPYDVSKSCADLIAQAYAATYGLPVVIARCGNFYGGGDLNWSRLVPGTIRSALRGESPIIRSDGQFVRDYFYAEDGAAAYTLLAEQVGQRQEMKGRAYNFSNESQLTTLALVERILGLMNVGYKPVVKGEATHEIRLQYLSAARARRELQWKSLFSLDEGLLRTISWYKEFLASSLD